MSLLLVVLSVCTICIYVLTVNRKEKKKWVLKRNPLKNIEVMQRLNPYAVAQKNIAKAVEDSRKKLKQERLDAKRGVSSVDVTFLSLLSVHGRLVVLVVYYRLS